MRCTRAGMETARPFLTGTHAANARWLQFHKLGNFAEPEKNLNKKRRQTAHSMVNLNIPYLDVHKYVRQNDKEANEMKLGKRIGAVALGTALALSIAACGGGTANKEDATEKIRAASEKVNAVESMEATMVMEMDMSVMGQKVETDTTMAMSCFNDPAKMKADMTMDMGSLGSVSMSILPRPTATPTICTSMTAIPGLKRVPPSTCWSSMTLSRA